MDLKYLIYRSTHRGCKEVDLLLGEFAKSKLHTLNSSELNQYELIVDLDDYLLYDYLAEKKPFPPSIPLLYKIISFNNHYFTYKNS